jgi:hypothetical protein
MRAFVVSLCAAILAVALFATRGDAGVIYAATAAGAAGELYILNPANGSVIQDVGPLNDALAVNYPITGLAFHPTTGVLYGSTGNAGTVDALLVTINPATAQVTVVGPYNAGPTNTNGDPTTMADLEFDPSGNLYGVASIGGPNLYSINALTGQATLVGANGASTSTTGGGLAISSANVFYGTPTASRFGTYNSSTGVYTNIANPVKPTGGGAYGALSWGEGTLYGLNVGSGSPPPTALVSINPANGAVTLIGNTLNSLDAITYIPEPGTASVMALGAVMALSRRVRRHTA